MKFSLFSSLSHFSLFPIYPPNPHMIDSSEFTTLLDSPNVSPRYLEDMSIPIQRISGIYSSMRFPGESLSSQSESLLDGRRILLLAREEVMKRRYVWFLKAMELQFSAAAETSHIVISLYPDYIGFIGEVHVEWNFKYLEAFKGLIQNRISCPECVFHFILLFDS